MIIGLTIILILYAIVFFIAEVLYQRGYTVKVTRKIVHIGGGMIAFLLPRLINFQLAITLGGFFVFFLFWSRKKQMLDSVHKVSDENLGAILFPVGLIACALLFWKINPLIFQGSALLLGLSDGLAGVFGHRFGKRGYDITGYKTLEGSTVFFLVTFIILISMMFFSQNDVKLPKIYFIVLGSLALSLIEGFFGRGWDNFFIPPFGGLIIYLIL